MAVAGCRGVAALTLPTRVVVTQLSLEKHKQLFVCQKVAAWIELQLEVFTSGNYGSTFDATKNIMDAFVEYTVVLEQHKTVRPGAARAPTG
jgi:hypothetical protein